jgi:hypothetical protein
MENDKPLIVMLDRARRWKDLLFLFLFTPALVLLVIYYFPFVLWNETFYRWSMRGLVVLWLLWLVWEVYRMLVTDDVLLVMNGYGIWAEDCPSKTTVAWTRVVDVIEKPYPFIKSDDVRLFEIIYRPDEPATGKNASFSFNTAQLRVDPEIIRKELRKHLKADGRQQLLPQDRTHLNTS